MNNTSLSNLIESISRSIKNSSVAIIGDICLDHYSFIDPLLSEFSVETALETVSIKSEKYRLGGAGNVAVNCRTLGIPQVDIYGVLGNDYQAKIITDLLHENQIGTDGLIIQNDQWQTHVYHKIINDSEELNRYDLGNFNSLSEETAVTIIKKLSDTINQYQCVIINEQVMRGMHTEYFIAQCNDLIKKHHDTIIWIADTRHFLGRYENVIYKFNTIEAATYCSNACDTEQTTEENGRYLSKKWNMPVIITCGENGALVCNGQTTHIINGIDFMEETDTVGAGDAFLAGTAAAIISGTDINNAAEIGNLAAAVSVLTLFETGNPTFEELKIHSQDPCWRHNAHLVKTTPTYLAESTIELINHSFTLNRRLPKLAIFDHDGTISTLRQGWESVMEQVMLQYILGNSEISVQQRKSIELKIKELIDSTTGIQTIIQMQYFVEMVRKENLVPFDKILTAEHYKKIYLEKLKETMKGKLTALRRDELDVEDFTIKASVNFLERLYKNGTRLYMASGTDKDDVNIEAELLGYSKLFGDRIFGSVGNVAVDPKKLVMQQIITEIEPLGYAPEECAVFGDGPVEMREGSNHNFATIGIISDEKQRFGVNQAKRPRLILAGADILVPDFSQMYRIFPEVQQQ